jgi:hypothetical protein
MKDHSPLWYPTTGRILALIISVVLSMSVTRLFESCQKLHSQPPGTTSITNYKSLISPNLLSPSSGEDYSIWENRDINFKWESLPEADYYAIEISKETSFELSLTTISRGGITSPNFIWTNPDPGQYYWRVRAFSKGGTPGVWSNPGFFIVDTRTRCNNVIPIILTDVFIVNEKSIAILGRTNADALHADALLKMNEKEIPVKEDGTFEVKMIFEDGKVQHKFQFKAIDVKGRMGLYTYKF